MSVAPEAQLLGATAAARSVSQAASANDVALLRLLQSLCLIIERRDHGSIVEAGVRGLAHQGTQARGELFLGHRVPIRSGPGAPVTASARATAVVGPAAGQRKRRLHHVEAVVVLAASGTAVAAERGPEGAAVGRLPFQREVDAV